MARLRRDFRTPRSTDLVGIELQNFKSIKSARIPVRPLTIVAGSNSAGKSSLLQAILALTQVSKRRIEGGRFPLNDNLAQLGTLTSLRHQNSVPDEPVMISFTFSSHLKDMRRAIGRRIGFSHEEFQQAGFNVDDQDDIEYTSIVWSIGLDSQYGEQTGSAKIATVTIDVETGTLSVNAEVERSDYFLDYDQEENDEGSAVYSGWLSYSDEYSFEGPYGASETISVADARISSGQISSFFATPPEPSQQVSEWFKQIEGYAANSQENTKTKPSLEDIESFFKQTVRAINRGDSPRRYQNIAKLYSNMSSKTREEAKDKLVDYFEERASRRSLTRLDDDRTLHLEGAQQACARYLAEHVHYVGPLRHAPHLQFRSAPDPDTGAVGVAGEHVAAILQTKRAASNRYPLPDRRDVVLTLEDAVNVWLRHLDMAESLTVRESTPLAYSVDLVPPGLDKAVPLSAVGVGVSQLLPVIVQCLVAGPGALVILEQPELHLHPAAQQRLADFLIACTNWGQRILVESHSEYLILRLRRRIAEDDSDELRKQVAILFAKRNELGETTYREVEMNKVGGVIDWPDDFFDQGQNEAHHLLVEAAKRQRRDEEAAKS